MKTRHTLPAVTLALSIIGVLTTVWVLHGGPRAAPSPSPGEPTLAQVRAATELLGITAPPSPRVDGDGTHTDFLKPGILIYEPQADGSMELVAVENLVFARSWRATGRPAPPTFHGVPYDTIVDDPATPSDEAHMFEPHFDRHVWIYRDNPNGVFAPFNPAVTCAHHRGARGHPHASH